MAGAGRMRPPKLASVLGLGLLLPALSLGLPQPRAAAAEVESPPGEAAIEVGRPLRPWRSGHLDIHHISTGRGEAQFIVLPDGTNLLVDASGATAEKPPFSFPTRPDASRPPGEWVARYVQRVLDNPAFPEDQRQIDYAMVSHFHGDHMGVIRPDSPSAANGAYRLSGITEVAEHIRVAKIVDRGWPGYDFPAPLGSPTVDNYRRFLAWQVRENGLVVERFAPGRKDQLVLLRDAKAFPEFEIRNIYANGQVWTGRGSEARNLFPPVATGEQADRPLENTLSIAFRIRYGAFDYFSGGDLSSQDEETTASPAPWKNVEPDVGKAAGPVDAMKANHHGSWDANGIPFLAAMRPRVIVVGARADGHPAQNTFARMTSEKVWPGERDIFITHLSAATATTTYGVGEVARGTGGHVVIRVEQGGASYRVFVLDDGDELMTVRTVSGPYPAR